MFNLQNYRNRRGLTLNQIAAELRKNYNGVDASLISKVENPAKYAVMLIPAAQLDLIDAFAGEDMPDVPVKRPDNRVLKARVQCRMTAAKKERLLSVFQKEGFPDVQTGLNHIINLYLYKKEK